MRALTVGLYNRAEERWAIIGDLPTTKQPSLSHH